MALFGMFGDVEHRVFNYKPIYYDPDKEERRKKFGKVDGSEHKEEAQYAPGSYIKGAFRGGNYARKRGMSKAQSVISLVGLLLVIIILIYIAKFYTIL